MRGDRDAVVVRAGLLGLALLALGLAVIQWTMVPGIIADSMTYLDPARSLARGAGLQHSWAYWDPVYETGRLPTPTTLWPPGYSLAIAGLVSLGMDPTTAGRLISLVCFSLLPLPLYALCRRLLPPAPALGGALVALALSPLVGFATTVATEVPFTLLATLSVVFTLRAREAASPKGAAFYWAMASLASGGAFLLRYVGLACLASVVLAAVISSKRAGRGLAWTLAAVPGGLMCLVVMARNWLLMGTPGQPLPRGDVFWPNLGRSLRTIAGDLLGSKELLGPGLSLLRPLQAVLLAGLVALALLSFARTVAAAHRARRPLPEAARVSGLIGLFLLLSSAFTLATLARWGGQTLEARYVAVYLPWAFLLVVGWAVRGDAPDGSRARRGALLASALWLACQGVVVARDQASAPAEGYVWSARHSPALAWIKANVGAEETVLTNRGAEIAYWCASPVLRLPRLPHAAKGVTTWEEVDDLAARAHARYLVHIVGFPESLKYDRAEFEFVRALDRPESFPGRPSIRLGEAVVYHVGRSARSRATPPGSAGNGGGVREAGAQLRQP